MSADPSVSPSLDAVTPSVSTDPVAVLRDHLWCDAPGRTCGCGWVANDRWMVDNRAPNRVEQHLSHVAAALREAGLIPEATTRVEWGVEFPPEFLVPGRMEGCEEWHARSLALGTGGRAIRRTSITYADHVTEWEPVE